MSQSSASSYIGGGETGGNATSGGSPWVIYAVIGAAVLIVFLVLRKK